MTSKITFALFFFLSVLFSCLLNGEESLFCPFDDRQWKIGFEDKAGQESITELILQNDDIASWQEMFTVQIIRNFPYTASDYITAVKKNLKEINIPVKTQFNVIEPASLNIIEMNFISNENKDKSKGKNKPSIKSDNEYNIGRAIKSQNDLYYIRYSSKNEDQFLRNKNDWINRFKAAHTSGDPQRTLEGRWLIFTPTGIFDQNKEMAYQPDYQFINNWKIGYSLPIPKNWTINRMSSLTSQKGIANLSTSMSFSSPNRSVEGHISTIDVRDKSSFNAIIDSFSKEFKEKYPRSKLVSKGDILTVLAQDGHYMILLNGNKKGWVTFLCKNKRVYCLEIWTEKEQFNDLKPTLEKIVLNFEIRV